MLRDEFTYYVTVAERPRQHVRLAQDRHVEIYSGEATGWGPVDCELDRPAGAAVCAGGWVEISKSELVADAAPRWFPELTWLTQSQAAAILGCHLSRVRKLVAAGRLARRGAARRLPSLLRADVVALAVQRGVDARDARLAAERRTKQDPKRAHVQGRQPPDAVHDWLTVAQAAELLSVTTVAVGARCRRGRLPHTWHGGKRWIQRLHVEIDQRARDAQKSRKGATGLTRPDLS